MTFAVCLLPDCCCRYEEFVENVLKANHRKCLLDWQEAADVVEQCKDLRRDISMLIKEDVSELETTVELGCQFFVKALVPDTSCILVDVGLNFRLEMPLADAEAFLEDKEAHLRNGLELKSKQVAKVKADIHEALHLIDLMTSLQSDPWMIPAELGTQKARAQGGMLASTVELAPETVLTCLPESLVFFFGFISGTAKVLRCSKSQENACEEACLRRAGLGSPLFTTCSAGAFRKSREAGFSEPHNEQEKASPVL
ncbi:Uxt [Symbiodinium sp. CCMP2592]|nr:Uxt [Symbiodinium sp. CCMP2592]